jgi:hypothetical protein
MKFFILNLLLITFTVFGSNANELMNKHPKVEPPAAPQPIGVFIEEYVTPTKQLSIIRAPNIQPTSQASKVNFPTFNTKVNLGVFTCVSAGLPNRKRLDTVAHLRSQIAATQLEIIAQYNHCLCLGEQIAQLRSTFNKEDLFCAEPPEELKNLTLEHEHAKEDLLVTQQALCDFQKEYTALTSPKLISPSQRYIAGKSNPSRVSISQSQPWTTELNSKADLLSRIAEKILASQSEQTGSTVKPMLKKSPSHSPSTYWYLTISEFARSQALT